MSTCPGKSSSYEDKPRRVWLLRFGLIAKDPLHCWASRKPEVWYLKINQSIQIIKIFVLSSTFGNVQVWNCKNRLVNTNDFELHFSTFKTIAKEDTETLGCIPQFTEKNPKPFTPDLRVLINWGLLTLWIVMTTKEKLNNKNGQGRFLCHSLF